ncbi:MAG: insulinase family protein [Alphaproteobacteria bacterium]|nr:insulinase family protein [Alphaproteobacteria bacterium]
MRTQSNAAAARTQTNLAGVLAGLCLLTLLVLITLIRPAHSMEIKEVKSPGGINAWLVESHGNPLLALRFAFTGGNSQDPEGKPGVANFLTAMLDEGAGELKSAQFQESVEEIAMRMSYNAGRDTFYGNFETLTENRDEAVKLLRLAITKPRFDEDAVERIRQQLLANLAYAARSPERLASKTWYETAFPDHAYGSPTSGTVKSVKAIGADDLEAYRKRIFARDNLKVVAVGDITPEELGKLLDDVFGGLNEKSELNPVAEVEPVQGGRLEVVELDVPQSVAIFGMGGLKRKDPDFLAGFVLNHIVGGGGFSAILMEEVREKRGLAYSVYSYLSPLDRTAIYLGSVATKNDAIAESLNIIRAELKKIAENGPTEEALKNAKSYLTGSYALRFDTNSKIASQLLGILVEDMGIDYVDNRNAQIEALTVDDLKKAAKRFLKPDDLIVVVVGKPKGLKPKG